LYISNASNHDTLICEIRDKAFHKQRVRMPIREHMGIIISNVILIFIYVSTIYSVDCLHAMCSKECESQPQQPIVKHILHNVTHYYISVLRNVTLILLFLFTETIMSYTRQYIDIRLCFIIGQQSRPLLQGCMRQQLTRKHASTHTYIHTYILHIPWRSSPLHMYHLTTNSPPPKRKYNE